MIFCPTRGPRAHTVLMFSQRESPCQFVYTVLDSWSKTELPVVAEQFFMVSTASFDLRTSSRPHRTLPAFLRPLAWTA